MVTRSNYIGRVAVGVDQLINTLCGGDPDETLSARAWRNRDTKKRWRVAQRFLDRLFFWQVNHCYQAFLSELNNKHLASVYATMDIDEYSNRYGKPRR